MVALEQAAAAVARDGGRPALGHVNLMVDTFIANANLDDLRASVRGLLATSAPAVAGAFTAAARHRLLKSGATDIPDLGGLVTFEDGQPYANPSAKLYGILGRVRALYGAGLGFASLRMLAVVIGALADVRWDESEAAELVLAQIDADISQGIQSAREEMESGRMTDVPAARAIAQELRAAVSRSQSGVKSWGGGFPFERGAAALEHWKF